MNNFSHDELEITELPEREEMLIGALLQITGISGVFDAIFPIGVNLGGTPD